MYNTLKMKCYCRSLLSITVGFINFLIFFGISIITFINLVDDVHDNDYDEDDIIICKVHFINPVLLLVISLVKTSLSLVFITGIIQSRHKLMLPWLVIATVELVIYVVLLIFKFCAIPFADRYLLRNLDFQIVLFGLLACVIYGLILWYVFTLYRDIRKANLEKHETMFRGAEKKFSDNRHVRVIFD